MHIKEPIIEIHQIDLKNAKLNKVYKISQSMLFALNKKKILDLLSFFINHLDWKNYTGSSKNRIPAKKRK